MVNTATVASTIDPNATNNSATDTDALTPQADLSVTKTNGQTTAIPGDIVTYTIVVANTGLSDVTGASITDTFPAILTGVTYTSVATGTVGGNTAAGAGDINETANMAAGSTITYMVTGMIDPNATGNLVNTATVSSAIDPNAANNSATDTDILTPQVDPVVTKAESIDPVVAGSGAGNLIYVVTVTNNGPSDATGVTINEDLTLPAGVTRDSVVPSVGSFVNTSAPDGHWTLDLAAGTSETLTITLTVGASTVADTDVISNTATVVDVAGGQAIVNTGDESATESTSVLASGDTEPQLASCLVSMQASGLRYNRRTGVMSSYITITNTSSQIISGDVHFVINSLSDPNVSLVGSDGTYDLTPYFNDGRFDPGESVTIRMEFYNPLRRRFTFDWDLWGILPPSGESDPATVGDFIWHDLYHGPDHLVDGIQDSGEPGIEDVIVNLLVNGVSVASAMTDAAGFYQFTDLNAGTYVVEVSGDNFLPGAVLEGWHATLKDEGGNDAADSDCSRTTYRSDPVTLTCGQDNTGIDFGFFTAIIDLTKTGPETAQVGETITYHFRVENLGDIVQHGGAQVYDPMINPCGDHKIWDGILQPGQVVEFDRAYLVEPDDVGELTNRALAVGHPLRPDGKYVKNVTDVDDWTVAVSPIVPDGTDTVTIGDFVWHDLYHGPDHLVDGIQDSGEPGIEGVTVNLLNNNIQVASATTDSNGFYRFTDLNAGTYVVEVSPDNFLPGGVLEGWYATLKDKDGNNAKDSDCNRTTYRSDPLTLTAGEENADIDFGFFTAIIDLTKTGPQTAQVGEIITYHFRVQNLGDVVQHGGAQVHDSMINPYGDHKIWNGILQPGQVVEFDRTYIIEPDDTGELINTALAVGHPLCPDGKYVKNVTDVDSWTVLISSTMNNAPVANDDVATTDEYIAVVVDVLHNDTDADGDILTVLDVTNGANGTVTNNGSDVAYAPDPGFSGTDSFSYTASDGKDGIDTATVMVTVNPVDEVPPVVGVDTLLTNDPTPELTGTVDDLDAVIEVTVGGSIYSVVNNGDGTWTLPDDAISPALADGIYDVAASATDLAGNTGTDTTTDELTVDTTAPVVTVNTLLTNDSTPKLTGTVNDPAAAVTVTVDGNSYSAVNNGDSTWTLVDDTIAPALADGTYDIAASATDLAGNTGTDITTDELTVDTSAPVVTVDTLLTNDNTPRLSGTVDDPAAIISITVGGSNAYSAINNGDGTWTLPDDAISPALADGIYDVSASATDLAGNAGTDTTTDELTVDTTPPVVTVDTLLTNDPTPELKGRVSDLDAVIEITVDGNTYAAINNGDGTWTLPDDAISPALADGIYDVSASATDLAGNTGTDTTTDELTVDTTAPVVTVNSLLTNDSTPELTGTIDDLDAVIAITVAGNAYGAVNNRDGTWTLPDDAISPALADGVYDVAAAATDLAGNTGTDATTDELTVDTTAPVVTVNTLLTNDSTPELTGTIDDSAAIIEITLVGITYIAVNNGDSTWTLPDDAISPALADGVYDVEASATDLVGNIGTDATADELTVDTTAPVVTVDTLLTNDSTPELTGTVDDPDATIEITVDGITYNAVNNGNGGWTLADDTISPALADGIYDVSVGATDLAGNTGTDTTTDELTVDTTAPVVTVGTLLTNDSAPELTGTVDDTDAALQITVDGNAYDAINNGDGTWTLPDDAISPALADGVYDVEASATDLAGNTGTDASTDELTVDTTAPVITVNTLLTNDNTPQLSGTVNDPAATISVTVGGNTYAAVNDADGTWKLADDTISPTLADGTYDVQASATDLAGNTGADVTTDELTVDTTAPVVTVNTLLTNDNTPALSGMVNDARATISVTVSGNSYAAVNNADGTWTLVDDAISPALADGIYDVAVTATDSASNVGSDATTDELTIDTAAPIVTVDTLLTNDNTPQLSGTVDDLAAIISVTVGGNAYSAINNANGTWTLQDDTISPALVDGIYDVAVTATDSASNVGTDATTDELAVDTTAPVVTVDTLLTNDPTPELTGTIDDLDAVIEITVDTNTYGAVNNGDGTWTLADDAIAPALADGIYDVSAAATDLAANIGNDATTNELTIDTTPPDVEFNLAEASDSEPIGDSRTTFEIVTLEGNTEPDTPVSLFHDSDPASPIAASVSDGTGFFAFDGVDLALGDNPFTVVATDLAGNEGSYSRTIIRDQEYLVYLIEGTNFEVTYEQAILVPDEPSFLAFTYRDLFFDTNDDFINDAFEAALLDSHGNSLVHRIASGRDAFFNITEELSASIGANTVIDGQTINLDLSHIPGGTQANLVIRLVNNDLDTTTSVYITHVSVEPGSLGTPVGSVLAAEAADVAEVIDFELLSDVTASMRAEYGRTSFNEDADYLYADLQLQNVGTYVIDTPLVAMVDHLSDPTVRVIGADGVTPDGQPYFDFSGLVADRTLEPSELTQSRNMTFFDPNGVQFSYDLVVLGMLNHAPAFISEPDIEALSDQAYSYDADATDLDGDVLTYSLASAPQAMTIDPSTGLIEWQPSVDDTGNHDVLVHVEDGRGGSAEQHYTLNVIVPPPNRPPVFTSVPVTETVPSSKLEGEAVQMDLRQWNIITYPATGDGEAPANWQIAPDGSSATQTINAIASILLSNEIMEDRHIEGTWSVNTYSDDDLMGFVFGYQDEGHFYLFDWKQNSQPWSGIPCDRGMSIKVVSADSPLNLRDLWSSVGNVDRVSILFHNDIPYQDYVEYRFKLDVQPGQFTITVLQDETVLETIAIGDSTYTSGKFGFYNYSQGEVLYSGFHEQGIAEITYRYDAEAVDPDGDTVVYSVVQGPEGMVINPSTGELTWNPTIDDIGQHPVGIDASDGRGGVAIQSFIVAVLSDPANNPPVIISDPVISVPPEQDYTYDVEAIDPDGDPLTYLLVQGPAGMTVEPATGLISWSAIDVQLGCHDVTVAVSDGRGGSDEQSFTVVVELTDLTVTNVDRSGLTYDGQALTAEGTVTAEVVNLGTVDVTDPFDVLFFEDLDHDGLYDEAADNTFGLTTVTEPLLAGDSITVSANVSGSVLFVGNIVWGFVDSGDVIQETDETNNLAHSGEDCEYAAGPGVDPVAAANLTASYVRYEMTTPQTPNNAPVAENQMVSTLVDTPVVITLGAFDPEGDPLTFEVVDPPVYGDLSGATPNLTYTPDPGYSGQDSFTFKANDGLSDSNIATVTITVSTVANHPPHAQDQAVATPVDTPVEMTLVGSDLDGDALTYTVVTGPGNGSLDGSAPLLTYTPNAGHIGQDTFTFRVNDGLFDSNVATVTVATGEPIGNPPWANNQVVATIDTPVNITLTGTDPDGDPLTFTIVHYPTGGTLTGTAPNLIYTPDANYDGPVDSLTFQVSDGVNSSNLATAEIKVMKYPIGDGPTADDQTVSTTIDTPVAITLTGLDRQTVPTYHIINPPAHGTLSGTSESANRTYTPDPGYFGFDSFTFVARSTGGGPTILFDSVPATVKIIVLQTGNNPPVAESQTVTAYTDTPAPITLAAVDPDQDPLTLQIVGAPANGTLSGTGANVTYTPALAYSGFDSFTFRASDGTMDSESATVDITVVGWPFTEIDPGIVGNSHGGLDWGDYDNDGDLDLAINQTPTRIYKNDSGVFTDIEAGLAGVGEHAAVEWGDYDADGDLDLVIAGTQQSPLASVTKIYRNDDGQFVDINAPLAQIYYAALAWGDYDVDGDLDLALCGRSRQDGQAYSRIYRNDAGVFVDVQAPLVNVNIGAVAWADYDSDGDLDLALTGQTGVTNTYDPVSRIYRNDNGVFADINANLIGVRTPGIDWGDYDNDGDPDLVIVGSQATAWPGGDFVSRVYRNDNGVFTDINAPLAASWSAAEWGDYDNDGDLDLAIQGKIYRNDDGSFVDINMSSGATWGDLDWGDYDNDGDLDLAVSGRWWSTYGFISKCILYRNDLNNAPPTAESQFVQTDRSTPVNITLVADDPESDPLTYHVVDLPTHGSLSGEGRNLVYTPDTGYGGSDRFTFRANDRFQDSNVATVMVIVGGEQVTFTVRVGNGGAVSMPASTSVAFYDGDPRSGGLYLGSTETTIPLEPGYFEDVEITLPVTNDTDIWVWADDDGTGVGQVNECNEEDNIYHPGIVFEGPTDLTITNVDRHGLTYDGQALTAEGTVTAEVTNLGPVDVTDPFDVLFFEDRDHDGLYTENVDPVFGTATITDPLPAGQSITISSQLSGSVLFIGNLVWGFVDSGDAVAETNETNNLAHSGENCVFIPVPGQFNPVIEWSKTTFNVAQASNQVIMTPAVIDLNNDGVPDIVFTTFLGQELSSNAKLRAISGSDGSELWTVTNPAYEMRTQGNIAVGDIDLDGLPEIIGIHETDILIAFEHDGTFKWLSSAIWGEIVFGGPSIADLDHDGVPEIVIGGTVLNADGTLRWRGDTVGGEGRAISSSLGNGQLSIVADLDLDGSPEVVAGKSSYHADGSLYWNSSIPDGFPAVGNFDTDNFPEIVVTTSDTAGLGAPGNVYLLEHTGDIKWGPVAIPGGYPPPRQWGGGAPTIADFDGDGEPEIGVTGAYRYVVYETDGSIKWQSATYDQSEITGSSVFDFEGDGIFEVVYADEHYLRIYNGNDGTILYEIPRSSATGIEMPIVVDVDGDGKAEIVAVGNMAKGGSTTGVFVIGDASDSWARTRQIWNQYSYHVTNINEDGTIPIHKTNSWQSHNTYRCNIWTGSGDPRAAANLTASYVQYAIGAGGSGGPSGLPAGAPIADNQIVTTSIDTPSTISLAASDPDGDSLTFTVIRNPTYGTLSGTAPNLTYTPNTAYQGQDSFTFLANDGTYDSNIGYVAIGIGSTDPINVWGDPFTKVAVGPTVSQLFALTSDQQGRVYIGNNSNNTSGIPVQRFDPSLYVGSPIVLEDFGSPVGDADGIAFAGDAILVPDRDEGVRRIPISGAPDGIFLPGIAINPTGSPLVYRLSDGHLFVGHGTDASGIDEYDANGFLVRSIPTPAGVETMTFDPATGLIYYGTFSFTQPSEVRALDPTTGVDVLIGMSSGIIDAGLAFDPVTGLLFVGTANGVNQGLVEIIDPQTGVTQLFASGFNGSLGILREPISGDLYFLDSSDAQSTSFANTLYRLESKFVESVIFTARIGNGGAILAPEGVSVSFYDGDPRDHGVYLASTDTTTVLPPGHYEDVEVTLPRSNVNDIWVWADDDGTGIGQVNECNEEDNIYHPGIVFEGPTDLTITDVDRSGLIYDGQALTAEGTVTAEITNLGPTGVTDPFDVLFFEDHDHDGLYTEGVDPVFGTVAITDPLPAGQSTTISAEITGSVLFIGNLVWGFVDSGNAIWETDETNNLAHSGENCMFYPEPGQFNPVIEWSKSTFSVLPGSDQVEAAPAVVDLNADGIPDIVFSTVSEYHNINGQLRAISGVDGETLWTVTDSYVVPYSSVAVGDIDMDGRPEIIAVSPSNVLIAFEDDGTFKWQSPTVWGSIIGGSASLADLDHDGVPEIVIGGTVLNNDGTIRWRGDTAGGLGRGVNRYYPLSVVADIDLDGSPEVVAGKSAYRADGSLYWNASIPDGFPAIGNFDDDDFAEIVVVSEGNAYLLEHTGAIKWGPVAMPAEEEGPGGFIGGAPVIADMDGDGEPEIGVAGSQRYVVFETDSTIKWQQVIQDLSSGMTGSTVFDFEGDGSAEILYADESYLRVYRGVDGAVLYEIALGSGTVLEYPVVADVDADGDAEIIAVANRWYNPSRTGIFVIGDQNGTWVNTRQIWNQYSYHITNVNDDGTIPINEDNSWQTHNTYRLNALPEGGLDPHSAPNLTGSYVQVNVGTPATSPVAHDQTIFLEPNTAVDITLTGYDPEGDPLEFIVIDEPIHGVLGGTAPILTYTPSEGYLGRDVLTFKVNDGSTDSNTATVEILIPGLHDLGNGPVAWGDIDNDGDLDLAAGVNSGPAMHLYKNYDGKFVDMGAEIEGGYFAYYCDWGDYDNDGDLDLAIAGAESGFADPISKIYRNDGGSFTDIDAPLVPVNYAAIAWGDYDNDGDLDLIMSGSAAGNPAPAAVTRLYRNDDGEFIDTQAGLVNAWLGSVAWGDYDNDGDLDLAIAGATTTGGDWNARSKTSKIYRNDNGLFVDSDIPLPGGQAAVAWADYDNDGDLDLTMASISVGTRIYRNDGGDFVDIGADLIYVSHGRLIAWGDYDNDGDLDLALSGNNNPAGHVAVPITRLYRNDDGVFIDTNTSLPGLWEGSLEWGDCDNDGDLDLILVGFDADGGTYGDGKPVTTLFINDQIVANSLPSAPSGLTALISSNDVTFSWNVASDLETPSEGLAYNLRVGTTPGGDEILSGMADSETGYRLIPEMGNVQKNLSWTLKDLPAGRYYWSVQAIDTAFAGGPWAQEQTFSIKPIFVDIEAAAGGDGTSWANAFSDLQDALSAAAASTVPTEIWVADGTYTPDQGTGNRVMSFHLESGLAIYGGFDGIDSVSYPGGETIRNQRDPTNNVTILSGDLSGNDIIVSNPKNLQSEATRAENSQHVVDTSGVDATAVMDGFTITGGRAIQLSSALASGGGGILNDGGSPTIVNCAFRQNSAYWSGGAVVSHRGNPTFVNSTFHTNYADKGSGAGADGGAIVIHFDTYLTVTSCSFINNSTGGGDGGAIFNGGENGCIIVATNCTFIGNEARSGGAILMQGYVPAEASSTLVNSIFQGNRANNGGAILASNGSLEIANCEFTGNSAFMQGGGILLISNLAWVNASITNSTISENTANVGGGIHNHDGNLVLTNCILWGNSDNGGIGESAQIYVDAGTPVINYTCVQGWTGQFGGTGNIADDPMFMRNPDDGGDGWGDDPGTPNIDEGANDDFGDLRLTAGSPCIDTGENSAVPPSVQTDLEGNPRILNGRVDMGAYEHIPSEEVTFTARIGNGGAVSTPAGTSISFYDGDPRSGGIYLGSTQTTTSLEPGYFEDVQITMPPVSVNDIWVWADDDGAGIGQVNECNEEDNIYHPGIILEPENNSPSFTSSPPTEVRLGQTYQYDADAFDPDGDPLVYDLLIGPEGMTLDTDLGTIEWMPQATQLGTHAIQLRVQDDRGGADVQQFQVTVRPENLSPVLTSLPLEEAVVNRLYRYNAIASDPDGDPLVFDLPVKPAGMAVDATRGIVVWIPKVHQVGVHDVILRVQDGRGGVDLQSFQVTVGAQNTPPAITSTPWAPAWVDTVYEYQVTAQDAEDDPLTFALETAPDGMTIDELTGLVNWTPTAGQIGNHPVVISVNDGQGATATQSFELPVVDSAVNDPPAITSTPRGNIALGQRYLYQIEATDPNYDPLVYSLDTAPGGMTVDGSGLVEWSPEPTQFGANSVGVRVEDGRGGWATQEFVIDVVTETTNSVPQIASTPVSATTIGVEYAYDAEATDTDGDPLFWQLDSAPDGMSINGPEGTVRWTPSTSQIGSHEIALRVLDGQGGWATQTFTLTVHAVNTAPAITSIPPTTGFVDYEYSYAVLATDPEGDMLQYSLDSGPAGMTVDPEAGLIQWTPEIAQVGNWTVEILVEDGRGGRAQQQYGILVLNETPNSPPYITSVPVQIANAGDAYTYDAEAIDPESEAIVFSLTAAPDGMTIDPDTGLVQWMPTIGQLGLHDITIVATDPAGGQGQQAFSMAVTTDNQAPVIDSFPQYAAVAGLLWGYDVVATDPDGDALNYSLIQAPAGMTIDGLGRVRWTPGQEDEGSHEVQILVADTLGAATPQSFSLPVIVDNQPPSIYLEVSQNPAEVGTEVTVYAWASDNVAVQSVVVTLDGTPLAMNSQGRATLLMDTVGQYEVAISATDLSGNTSTDSLILLVIDTSDVTAPFVEISSPAYGDTITTFTDIFGTVTDDNLLSCAFTIPKVTFLAMNKVL